MNHIYTCLPATDLPGFSVIVAKESDRIPLAAFKDGKDASEWCDKLNSATQKADVTLTQKADVTVVRK